MVTKHDNERKNKHKKEREMDIKGNLNRFAKVPLFMTTYIGVAAKIFFGVLLQKVFAAIIGNSLCISHPNKFLR
jgi:hypothetical protein